VDPLVQEVFTRTEAEGDLISWCSLLFGPCPFVQVVHHVVVVVVPSCHVENLSFHPLCTINCP
jgi:hypothetical protein